MALPAPADVTVNTAQTVTRRVIIQPIRVRKTTGETATTFGTPESERYIKTQINRIWAQVGVRIDWRMMVDYTNNFAFDGSPSDYTSSTRPSSHLGQIIANAPTPPKSSDATVINMFFIEIVPGFNKLAENYANGHANADANGIAMHVGDVLPTFQNGRDVVAHVIAHEIGHNLGLYHESSGANNLMAQTNATSARLTSTQKTTIFTDHAGTDGYELLKNLPAATQYDQWMVARTTPGRPNEDPDGDGLSNILEFMFDLDPLSPDTLPAPVPSVSGLTWTLPKRSAALTDGIVYSAETSGTLSSWLPAGNDSGRSSILTNSGTLLEVRLNPGADRSFMRLNIQIPSAIANGY